MNEVDEPAGDNPWRRITAEEIDECVRDIFRNHMKPHLREVYREILGERPNPNPDDFFQGSEMYEVTAKDPGDQPTANLMQRVLDSEFGKGTPIGDAMSAAVRDLYVREWLGESVTDADIEAAFVPVLAMAREKYGDSDAQ